MARPSTKSISIINTLNLTMQLTSSAKRTAYVYLDADYIAVGESVMRK